MAISRISFIVPCYNGRRTIERAIRSALDSEKYDVEVLVIDDASTDDSISVVEAIRDSRVRVIPQLMNTGPSNCRNVGIEAAKGDWVAILDADDWVASQRLQLLLSKAEPAGLDMIADNQWVMNQKGERVRQRFSPLERFGIQLSSDLQLIDLKAVIKATGLGILKPLICRKFLIDSGVRYRPQFKYGEDYHLLFDLVRAGAKFGYIDEPFYYAELIEGSLTSNRVAMFRGMIDVLSSVRRDLDGSDASQLRLNIDEAIENCHRTIAYGAVIDPLKQRRFAAVAKAMIQYPGFWTQLPGRLFWAMRGKVR